MKPVAKLCIAHLIGMLAGGVAALGVTGSCSDAGQIASGEVLYRVHCAACHGKDARGEGPMAEVLKAEPTDLVALDRKSYGDAKMIAAIDGRTTVRGHGSSEMPVWGLSFRESGRDTPQESLVRDRIRDLICYLRSLQTEP